MRTRVMLMTLAAALTLGGALAPARADSPERERGHKHDHKKAKKTHEHKKHKHKHKHGPHGHRFVKPERHARRWNADSRDAWQKPEQIVAQMALEPGQVAADLGAGTGYLLGHLSEAVGPKGQVIALDAEEAMIEYLEGKRDELGENVQARKVPWDDPGLEPDSVDALVTLNTWHHVRERVAYAEKIRRGLKPGGRFVVVEFTKDSPNGPPKRMRLTAAQVKKELVAAGFQARVVKDEELPRHHIVVGVRPEQGDAKGQ